MLRIKHRRNAVLYYREVNEARIYPVFWRVEIIRQTILMEVQAQDLTENQTIINAKI